MPDKPAVKMLLSNALKGMGFWRAYRFCRHCGLKPWCAVRLAWIYT